MFSLDLGTATEIASMAASKQRSQKLFPLLLLLCMVAAWKQSSFVGIGSYRRQPKTSRWAVCAQVKEPPAEGDRVVVDGDDGPIVVAKIDGKYYAVDAKCPHLGLPMKQGKIENGPDGPTLTCNFHKLRQSEVQHEKRCLHEVGNWCAGLPERFHFWSDVQRWEREEERAGLRGRGSGGRVFVHRDAQLNGEFRLTQNVHIGSRFIVD